MWAGLFPPPKYLMTHATQAAREVLHAKTLHALYLKYHGGYGKEQGKEKGKDKNCQGICRSLDFYIHL